MKRAQFSAGAKHGLASQAANVIASLLVAEIRILARRSRETISKSKEKNTDYDRCYHRLLCRLPVI